VHPFQFRPMTIDERVFHLVCERNEYRIPDAFGPDDIIIDVGMHIGSFCYAALLRGSNRVHGFEAQEANYQCAVHNLRSFGDRVSLNNKAVWRSDKGVQSLTYSPPLDADNTGGGTVWGDGQQKVEAIPLDEIILSVTDGGRKRVRLLKVDCEGSEFPILLTSRKLHLVDQIVGEYHEFGGEYDSYKVLPERLRVAGYKRLTIQELGDALRKAGFDVDSERLPQSHLGVFFATRKIPAHVRLMKRAIALTKRPFS
jgi:FkbM family methyltransferase